MAENKLIVNRLSDNSLASTIDNKLGELEEVLCVLLGVEINEEYSGAHDHTGVGEGGGALLLHESCLSDINAEAEEFAHNTHAEIDEFIAGFDPGGGQIDPAKIAILGDDDRIDRLNAPSAFAETFNCGESLAEGDLCYVDPSSGDMFKTSALTEAICGPVRLGICTDTYAHDESGTFIMWGYVTKSGWSWGSGPLYVSETSGALTSARPTAADSIVRIIGYIAATTEIFFCPDTTYIKLQE
jgi:hypothetical protein